MFRWRSGLHPNCTVCCVYRCGMLRLHRRKTPGPQRCPRPLGANSGREHNKNLSRTTKSIATYTNFASAMLPCFLLAFVNPKSEKYSKFAHCVGPKSGWRLEKLRARIGIGESGNPIRHRPHRFRCLSTDDHVMGQIAG
jgi:hypothetical protein